jgi:hypothetical protein
MPRKVKTVPTLAEVLVSIAEPLGRKLVTFKYGRRNQSLYQVVGLRRVDQPGVVDVLMRTTRCGISEVMRLDYIRSEACLLDEPEGFWPPDLEVTSSRKPARPLGHYDRLAIIASILGDTDERLYLDGKEAPDSVRIDLIVFDTDRRANGLTAQMLGVADDRSKLRVYFDFVKQSVVLNKVRVPESELTPA